MSGRWHFLPPWLTGLKTVTSYWLRSTILTSCFSFPRKVLEVWIIGYETSYSKYLQRLKIPIFLWQKISKISHPLHFPCCILFSLSFSPYLNHLRSYCHFLCLVRIGSSRLVALPYFQENVEAKRELQAIFLFNFYYYLCVCPNLGLAFGKWISKNL